MNFLFDIGHPAHYYLYKNAIGLLKEKGHKVLITTKRSVAIENILDHAGIPYLLISGSSDSLTGKLFGQFIKLLRFRSIARKNRTDIAVGSTLNVALLPLISRVKSVVFDDDDDEVQPLFTKYAHPYCTYLLSPDVLASKRKRENTIYYPGYHELAYLHPKVFSPDPAVPEKFGLAPGETYFLLRFNSFKAHHDVGAYGLSFEQKMELVRILESHGRVFISGEREIEPEIRKYQIDIPSEEIHSFMAYSSFFIGDSQTMTSEAAVLGVPSIRCNTFAGRIAYLEEEEHRYGLTFGFHPSEFEKLKEKLLELLTMKDLKASWKNRSDSLLKQKINVSEFMSWFLENLPGSGNTLENNPSATDVFK